MIDLSPDERTVLILAMGYFSAHDKLRKLPMGPEAIGVANEANAIYEMLQELYHAMPLEQHTELIEKLTP